MQSILERLTEESFSSRSGVTLKRGQNSDQHSGGGEPEKGQLGEGSREKLCAQKLKRVGRRQRRPGDTQFSARGRKSQGAGKVGVPGGPERR